MNSRMNRTRVFLESENMYLKAYEIENIGGKRTWQEKKNKVEFGLRNCYYAVITEGESGKITYGAPKKLPGAVSITFDKSGDLIRFKADDIDYYTNANNQGYEGTLTLARVPEDFRTEVLKEEKTEKGVILENSKTDSEYRTDV